MKNITELYDAYLAKEREERRINERIIDRELQIARLEKKKSKLGGWHANLVIRRRPYKSCFESIAKINLYFLQNQKRAKCLISRRGRRPRRPAFNDKNEISNRHNIQNSYFFVCVRTREGKLLWRTLLEQKQLSFCEKLRLS